MLLVIIANQASKMGSSLPKMRIKPGSEQQPPTDAELIATLTSGHEAASAGQEAVVATRRSQSGKPSGPRGIRQARVSDMVNLEVVGGHRLYDLYQNLFLAFAVAKQSGLCLAPLHTGRIPGTLYAPSFNGHNFTAVPLEAFADVASDKAPCRATALPPDAPRFQMRAFNTSCSAGDSHPADGATAAQAHRIRAQPRARWCPQRVDGRLVSIDVCVSVCSADGNSYRPAGEAIREAAELVAARSSTSAGHRSRASLVLQLGRGHAKSIARVTHYGQLHRGWVQVRLSQPMAALGAEYVRVYLGCGATHGRTVGASLRIIYDGGKRHTPTSFKEGCKSSFKALGRSVGRPAGAARTSGRRLPSAWLPRYGLGGNGRRVEEQHTSERHSTMLGGGKRCGGRHHHRPIAPCHATHFLDVATRPSSALCPRRPSSPRAAAVAWPWRQGAQSCRRAVIPRLF